MSLFPQRPALLGFGETRQFLLSAALCCLALAATSNRAAGQTSLTIDLRPAAECRGRSPLVAPSYETLAVGPKYASLVYAIWAKNWQLRYLCAAVLSSSAPKWNVVATPGSLRTGGEAYLIDEGRLTKIPASREQLLGAADEQLAAATERTPVHQITSSDGLTRRVAVEEIRGLFSEADLASVDCLSIPIALQLESWRQGDVPATHSKFTFVPLVPNWFNRLGDCVRVRPLSNGGTTLMRLGRASEFWEKLIDVNLNIGLYDRDRVVMDFGEAKFLTFPWTLSEETIKGSNFLVSSTRLAKVIDRRGTRVKLAQWVAQFKKSPDLEAQYEIRELIQLEIDDTLAETLKPDQ